MATFLTTRGISSKLEEIFIDANSFLYIVTPYLQFSKTLYERLYEATKRGVPTSIICRDRQKISSVDERLLLDLDCSVYFKSDLHAKCYLNEYGAMIASMNLYNYSEANNREMGVFLSKTEDSVSYDKCLKEVRSIINASQQFRLFKQQESIITVSEPETYSDFLQGWHSVLSQEYPQTQFSLSENRLSATDFPLPGMLFSNEYGFATVCFDAYPKLQNQRNEKKHALETALKGYRLYWHTGNRICLYQAKDSQFESLEQEYLYCKNGLALLVNELSNLISI